MDLDYNAVHTEATVGNLEVIMKAHLTLLAIFAIIPTIANDAPAQKSNRSPSRPSGLSSARDRQERTFRMDHLTDGINKAKAGDPKLAMQQIRDDFVRIQEINNLLLEAASKAPPVKAEMVAQAAKEVGERAQRLRSNLGLPDPPEQEDPEQATRDDGNDSTLAGVIEQINLLDASITAFVNNPMFRTLHVIDQELAMKAGSELRKIRDASYALRRRADKLRRAAPRK
jgi:hypothetical protein